LAAQDSNDGQPVVESNFGTDHGNFLNLITHLPTIRRRKEEHPLPIEPTGEIAVEKERAHRPAPADRRVIKTSKKEDTRMYALKWLYCPTMIERRLLASAFFGLAIAVIPGVIAHAITIYDANADFAPNSHNPNGVWKYGYSTTLGGSLVQFSEYFTDSFGFGWHTNLSAGVPQFIHFNSAGLGVLPGEASLHGGPNGEYAVLRFTAPTPGSYDILASWRGPGDSGDTDLYLLQNSALTLGSTSSTTTSGMIQVSALALDAGHTIDLAVGTKGSFISDNTPVNLVITQLVPEPSSFFLVLFSALLVRYSSRKWVEKKC
jgi:hypothetical protein